MLSCFQSVKVNSQNVKDHQIKSKYTPYYKSLLENKIDHLTLLIVKMFHQNWQRLVNSPGCQLTRQKLISYKFSCTKYAHETALTSLQ